jgi:predicted nucleic acid-binding protein
VDLVRYPDRPGPLLGGYGLMAREAIHVAVVHRHGVERITSFDTDDDRFPGIERVC